MPVYHIGDLARCADALRVVADEVFDERMTPERHEAAEHNALMFWKAEEQ